MDSSDKVGMQSNHGNFQTHYVTEYVTADFDQLVVPSCYNHQENIQTIDRRINAP